MSTHSAQPVTPKNPAPRRTLADLDALCAAGHRRGCLHEFFAVNSLDRGLREDSDA